MEDRFRVDGRDLGVDRRRSFAMVDASGLADGVVAAAEPLAGAPARLVITRIPLRFDGETFGRFVDSAFRDRLFVESLAPDDGDPDEVGDFDDLGWDDGDPDDASAVDAGVALHAGSRVEADGRLTAHAGERLRFVGDVALPGSSAPMHLDVSLTFGRRRRRPTL